MSYILEALRKSEIERKQGEVPSLGSSVQIIHKPGKDKASWLLWGLLIALMLNGMLLVWLFWPQPGVQVSSAPVTPVVQPTAVSAQATVPEQPVAPENKAADSLPRQAAGAQNAGDVSDRSLFSAPNTTHPPVSRERPSGVDASPEVHSGPGTVTSAHQPAAGSTVEVASAGPTSQAADLERQPEDPAVAPELAKPIGSRSPADVAGMDGNAVPALGSMPAGFQRRVPDLVFNSHIFSSRPDARRVMINSEYLREGARFGDMVVEEITEDGVILSLQGEFFAVSVVRNWNQPR